MFFIWFLCIYLIMKFIWYISSLSTIFLVLINNPKSEGFGRIGSQTQLFSYTRSTQKKLLIFTVLAASVFLLLTIILTSHFTI